MLAQKLLRYPTRAGGGTKEKFTDLLVYVVGEAPS